MTDNDDAGSSEDENVDDDDKKKKLRREEGGGGSTATVRLSEDEGGRDVVEVYVRLEVPRKFEKLLDGEKEWAERSGLLLLPSTLETRSKD